MPAKKKVELPKPRLIGRKVYIAAEHLDAMHKDPFVLMEDSYNTDDGDQLEALELTVTGHKLFTVRRKVEEEDVAEPPVAVTTAIPLADTTGRKLRA